MSYVLKLLDIIGQWKYDYAYIIITGMQQFTFIYIYGYSVCLLIEEISLNLFHMDDFNPLQAMKR